MENRLNVQSLGRIAEMPWAKGISFFMGAPLFMVQEPKMPHFLELAYKKQAHSRSLSMQFCGMVYTARTRLALVQTELPVNRSSN